MDDAIAGRSQPTATERSAVALLLGPRNVDPSSIAGQRDAPCRAFAPGRGMDQRDGGIQTVEPTQGTMADAQRRSLA